MEPIDLTEEIGKAEHFIGKKRFGWKLRVAIFIIKGIALISFIVAASFVIHSQTIRLSDYVTHKADQFYVATLESLPKSILPPESKVATRLPYTLNEAIKRVAREQKVPEVALAAMVEQESSNGAFLTSKIEDRVFARLVKTMPGVENERLEQLARSHGPGHVLGITALEVCDMEYTELYDNYKGLTCAAKYLKIQLDKSKDAPIEQRLWQAFRRYNGEGARAEEHADKVYALMRKKMTSDLAKELS